MTDFNEKPEAIFSNLPLLIAMGVASWVVAVGFAYAIWKWLNDWM